MACEAPPPQSARRAKHRRGRDHDVPLRPRPCPCATGARVPSRRRAGLEGAFPEDAESIRERRACDLPASRLAVQQRVDDARHPVPRVFFLGELTPARRRDRVEPGFAIAFSPNPLACLPNWDDGSGRDDTNQKQTGSLRRQFLQRMWQANAGQQNRGDDSPNGKRVSEGDRWQRTKNRRALLFLQPQTNSE